MTYSKYGEGAAVQEAAAFHEGLRLLVVSD